MPCISLCFAGHYYLVGSWTSRNKDAIFFFAEIRISCKIFQLHPKKEFPSPFLSARSARKKFHHFPLESSYFYRTSRPFWPSSSGCERLCDLCVYQLICI